jgi:DNA-binding LacI/PurR family transcriptional regulator
VGIVIPVDDYYFPSILAGVRDALDERAVRRSLVRSLRDPRQERKLVQELLGSGVTGLVLAPSIDLHEPDAEYAGWLHALPVPVVLVEREVSDRESGVALSTVRTDHEVGCRQAVAHLAKLGHRGVALVAHGRSQSGTRVIDGWREAVSRAGLAGRLSPLVMVGAQYASDAGIDAMLDQLRAAQATAVICHSDELALPLAHRARLRGWSVPADLSVISHDDESAEMADPPLTAVSPPKTWIGRSAIRMLLEQLAEGDQSPVRHVVAEPRLVLRNSTAPPRTTKLR